MASAVREPVEPIEHRVVLTLTEEEATALRDVTRAIGGPPQTSRRAHTEAISDALVDAGVQHTDGADVMGYLKFKEF